MNRLAAERVNGRPPHPSVVRNPEPVTVPSGRRPPAPPPPAWLRLSSFFPDLHTLGTTARHQTKQKTSPSAASSGTRWPHSQLRERDKPRLQLSPARDPARVLSRDPRIREATRGRGPDRLLRNPRLNTATPDTRTESECKLSGGCTGPCPPPPPRAPAPHPTWRQRGCAVLCKQPYVLLLKRS